MRQSYEAPVTIHSRTSRRSYPAVRTRVDGEEVLEGARFEEPHAGGHASADAVQPREAGGVFGGEVRAGGGVFD